MKRLNTAAKVRRLADEYDLSDFIVGQGSYGKVFKAR